MYFTKAVQLTKVVLGNQFQWNTYLQNNTFTRLQVMQQFLKPTLDHIYISKVTKTPRRRVILSDSMEKSNSNLTFPWGTTRITCQKLRYETFPEAQRTQAIESEIWISEAKTNTKSRFSTFSLPPLLGDHLSHLVHLPVILFVHHHLNDTHHMPNGPKACINCRNHDHEYQLQHPCTTFPTPLQT